MWSVVSSALFFLLVTLLACLLSWTRRKVQGRHLECSAVLWSYSAVCSLFTSPNCHGFNQHKPEWNLFVKYLDMRTFLRLSSAPNICSWFALRVTPHPHTNAGEAGEWPLCDLIDSSAVKFSIYLKARPTCSLQQRSLRLTHNSVFASLTLTTDHLQHLKRISSSRIIDSVWCDVSSVSLIKCFVTAKIFMTAQRQMRKLIR